MNKSLGQVFTKNIIADYMVSLFDFEKADILDPCFGTGAFIKSIYNLKNYRVTGIEIDKELFDTFKPEDGSSVCLINRDFLTYEPEQPFHGVIMNPPYIRHELIDTLKQYGISKKVLRDNPLFDKLPTNANLYMYFIAKAISVIKDDGQIIIIFPLTWMNARNGNAFKKLINEQCKIEKTIYVKGKPFEQEALVDVVILKMIKTKRYTKSSVEFKTKNHESRQEEDIERKQGENQESRQGEDIKQKQGQNKEPWQGENKEPWQGEYNEEAHEIIIEVTDTAIKQIKAEDTAHVKTYESNFNKYATIRRGLTTGHNKMYINPPIKDNKKLQKIISSPKAISGYTALQAQTDNILIINSDDKPSEAVRKYVKRYEAEIKRSKKPKTLYNKIIAGNSNWYAIKPFDCSGIVFGYIVRDSMRFILNPTDYLIRDNFYVIKPKIDILLMLALLNNYYTFYQLENKGKKYGAGLLKLQKYDLEELKLPMISLFNDRDIKAMIKAADNLAHTGEVKFIDEITETISKYENIPYERIKTMYLDKKKSRLGD